MAKSSLFSSLSTLLPRLKRISHATGAARFAADTPALVDCDDERVAKACRRMLAGEDRDRCRDEAVAEVRVVEDSAGAANKQGYRLSIEPDRAIVVGQSAAGCFYGLQTLGQLIRAGDGEVPCCEIQDEPDFATRGLLHDITRGKVPMLDTLKLIADRMALFKCNQLQLNIEHAFVFSFDPSICDADHGIIPEEVRELDAYCRDRFIDLVPALANLGHMGRILSMPEYRHLAEVEATSAWEQMSWPQRLRGLTLDVTNPESHTLVERMWSDVLDAFSSPLVNICGDEPWDLGKGKSAGRVAPEKIGEVYIEHIRRVADLCASRGRTCQAWSDVVVNYPDLFDRLPRDLTILHWGYEDNADHAGIEKFVRAGLETFVCPGTSGWKRIVNTMDVAERNIASFARAGRQHGASGLLNTDWGDLGHFNQLACSWHAIALGAACGWDADHPTGSEFDERFARTVWGIDDPTPLRLLREMTSACGEAETWRLLHAPPDEVRHDPTFPAVEQLEVIRETARHAYSWFERETSPIPSVEQDFHELAVAAGFVELFAERTALLRGVAGIGAEGIARRIDSAFHAYRQLWMNRNKPAGLADIAAAIGA